MLSPPGGDVLDLDVLLRHVGGQPDADGANDPDVGPLLHVVPAAHLTQTFEPRFGTFLLHSETALSYPIVVAKWCGQVCFLTSNAAACFEPTSVRITPGWDL